MSDFKVLGRGVGGDYVRRLFSGTEEDARDFVVRNFPRMHAEPNTLFGNDQPEPDVVLKADNGNLSHYDGKNWVDRSKDSSVSEEE